MQRFKLKKLNEAESKLQERVEVSERFAFLEDLDAEMNINSVWETIKCYEEKHRNFNECQ
jgi:hypothetical protein